MALGIDLRPTPEFAAEAHWVASLFERAGAEARSGGAAVILERVEAGSLGREGYRLTIDASGVRIQAETSAGAFYAAQTIRMLLPPAIESGERMRAFSLPCLEIIDRPRFSWRGYLLDVSRHFFDAEEIKRVIDWLALHKMNVFHWHLTDDGGWRMESKRYPNLTELGAWRMKKDFLWDYQDIEFPGRESGRPLYGGLYTQDEIREVVRYAAERHVTVLPEIEMPGHSLAACWSYPELTCTEEARAAFAAQSQMARPNVFCAGSEATFEFLENVLLETMALFPSEVIHIGGDEVSKLLWKNCARCQARMKAEGLNNEEELQSYFVRRIEKFLNAHGRKMMGWDEILEGGLAPGALVMSWRGIKGGIEAAKQGHHVVMTPTSHCYYDYSYDFVPTSKALLFDPLRDLNEAEQRFVLGGQANLWTEYVPTLKAVEQRTFPRLAATAEALWSGPGDGADLVERLGLYVERLGRMGIAYEGSAAAREGAFQEGVMFLNA